MLSLTVSLLSIFHLSIKASCIWLLWFIFLENKTIGDNIVLYFLFSIFKAHEDPMYDIIRENKRHEKEKR